MKLYEALRRSIDDNIICRSSWIERYAKEFFLGNTSFTIPMIVDKKVLKGAKLDHNDIKAKDWYVFEGDTGNPLLWTIKNLKQ